MRRKDNTGYVGRELNKGGKQHTAESKYHRREHLVYGGSMAKSLNCLSPR